MGCGCVFCVFYLNLGRFLLYKPNLDDILVTPFLFHYLTLVVQGSSITKYVSENVLTNANLMQKAVTNCRKFSPYSFILTFFFFYPFPALPPVLCLYSILFARRCPSLSGLVQTHTTTPLSNIRPWLVLFCPRRATNKVQACRRAELFASFMIHTGRTSDHQGLINNLWLWLKLSYLADLNGNV